MKHCAEALAKEPELAEAYMLQSLHQVMLALRAAESDPAGTGTRQLAAEAMQVSADAIAQSMLLQQHAVNIGLKKHGAALKMRDTRCHTLQRQAWLIPLSPYNTLCAGVGAAALQEAQDDCLPDGTHSSTHWHSQH